MLSLSVGMLFCSLFSSKIYCLCRRLDLNVFCCSFLCGIDFPEHLERRLDFRIVFLIPLF